MSRESNASACAESSGATGRREDAEGDFEQEKTEGTHVKVPSSSEIPKAKFQSRTARNRRKTLIGITKGIESGIPAHCFGQYCGRKKALNLFAGRILMSLSRARWMSL